MTDRMCEVTATRGAAGGWGKPIVHCDADELHALRTVVRNMLSHSSDPVLIIDDGRLSWPGRMARAQLLLTPQQEAAVRRCLL